MNTKKFKVAYWSLRVITLAIGVLLLLFAFASFVMRPFFASEGDPIRLQDRTNMAISAFLLFCVTIVPNSLTIEQPYLTIRIALIVLVAGVDFATGLYADWHGLTRKGGLPGSYVGIIVGGLLVLTLFMRRKLNRADNWQNEHT
jgi:hypothetical protein